MHIATLAVSLKVPIKKLEALEAGRIDQLPDAVFVRALASSVCRTLKLDPAAVLANLPQTIAPRLAQDEAGINMPFRSPDERGNSSWLEHVSRPALMAGLVLVLGALVLIFLPQSFIGNRQNSDRDAEKTQDVFPLVKSTGNNDQATPAEPVNAMPGLITNAPAEMPVNRQTDSSPVVTEPARPVQTLSRPTAQAGASGVPAPPATLSVPAPAAAASAARTAASAARPTASAPRAGASAPKPGVSAPIEARAPAIAAKPAVPASATLASLPSNRTATLAPIATGTGLLSFRATGESWVEVTDAKGQQVLRRTLQAGESVDVNGVAPLAIVIGRADATRLQVRGKPFDLQPVAKDNVARFEVK